MAIPANINETTEQHLQNLIAAEVREDKSIEYKRDIAVGTSEQKRKFVRSVTSFANASGGNIVFGMEAEDGKPVKLIPLSNFDPDQGIMLLRDVVRTNVQPPLFGVTFKAVQISGGWALLIHIPRSWNPPHMVTFETDNRFYTRDASGCVPMNVAEIRSAFQMEKSVKERIQNFRFERLSAIRAGELPFPVPQHAVSVLHVMPFRSFTEDTVADMSAFKESDADLYPPTDWRSCGPRYDIDGRYTAATDEHGNCANYLFVHRSGCIEALTAAALPSRQGKFIGNPHFEKQWISFIARAFTILRKIGAEPPFAFALTLLDVRDYALYSGMENPLPFHGGRPLNRRDLNLPIVTASQFNQDGAELMKPAFDALWNACGLERCFNYAEQGAWSPRRWG